MTLKMLLAEPLDGTRVLRRREPGFFWDSFFWDSLPQRVSE